MPTTFTILTHDTWGNAREGWDVNQSYSHGTITVDAVTPRKLISAMREAGLTYNSKRMACLRSAIRSTPYMGGHIDLMERNGKPVGFLQREESTTAKKG